MSSKSKTTAIMAIVFVVGYFVGTIVGIPDFNSEVGSGNISMVSKFHKNTVSPTMSAFQEKLMNDPEALERAALSLAVISSRMAEFNALVDVALEASQDVPELAEYVETLKNMKTVSENAEQNGKAAIESFDQTFLQKNGAASDYEQTSQKLTLAYLLVDRQMKVAKEYVASIDKVLGNNPESNMKLAAVRDLWARYCAGNAYLNDDDSEKKYWDENGPVLSGDQLSAETENNQFPNIVKSSSLGWAQNQNENFGELLRHGVGNNYGIDSDNQLGLHRDDQLGLHRDDQLGLHRDDQLGLRRDDQLGLHRDDQLGLRRDDQLGLHRDDQLGLGRGDLFGFVPSDNYGK